MVFKKTKTEVIVEAINRYYEKEDNELDSYTLGLPFFPKEDEPGSGLSDHSINHKKYFCEAIQKKYNKECEEFEKHVEELKKKQRKERKSERKNSY